MEFLALVVCEDMTFEVIVDLGDVIFLLCVSRAILLEVASALRLDPRAGPFVDRLGLHRRRGNIGYWDLDTRSVDIRTLREKLDFLAHAAKSIKISQWGSR